MTATRAAWGRGRRHRGRPGPRRAARRGRRGPGSRRRGGARSSRRRWISARPRSTASGKLVDDGARDHVSEGRLEEVGGGVLAAGVDGVHRRRLGALALDPADHRRQPPGAVMTDDERGDALFQGRFTGVHVNEPCRVTPAPASLAGRAGRTAGLDRRKSSDRFLLQLAALPLGETAPDAEALVLHQRRLEAARCARRRSGRPSWPPASNRLFRGRTPPGRSGRTRRAPASPRPRRPASRRNSSLTAFALSTRSLRLLHSRWSAVRKNTVGITCLSYT